MTTLDTLIYCLIDKDIISEEVKRKLISHFKSWVSFIGTKKFCYEKLFISSIYKLFRSKK